MRFVYAIAAIAILIAGCSGLDAQLVGKYKCSVTAKTGYEGPASGFVQALGNAIMSGSLELKADRTFSIVMLGMPADGSWLVESGKLKLTPTNESQAIVLEISPECDRLTTKRDNGEQLVFNRQR